MRDGFPLRGRYVVEDSHDRSPGGRQSGATAAAKGYQKRCAK
jgi:hypothetical protein